MAENPTALEILHYIVEYADRIQVMEHLPGHGWSNYRLTELPPDLLAKHITRFLRDGRLPHRMLHHEETAQ